MVISLQIMGAGNGVPPQGQMLHLYFRIFNPLLQSERFDPDGNFIRRYCPELRDLNNHEIHDPHNRNPLLAKKSKYPKPIIDIKKNRAIFLNAFNNKSR